MEKPLPQPLWKRLGWFVLLWAGGVLFMAVIAYAVKVAIPAA